MDAFYEEDERIVGHAAGAHHRVDIRGTSRRLVVRQENRVIADSARPLVLYESGFAPRWYVPRADVDESALTPAPGQTFCPYKGLCDYWDIGGVRRAAWSYLDAYAEVRRISGLISFEPDKTGVYLGGVRLRLEPGQAVVPHGPDRDLNTVKSPPAGGDGRGAGARAAGGQLRPRPDTGPAALGSSSRTSWTPAPTAAWPAPDGQVPRL
jgi:uncharacterized protein (DUF427 family)